MFAHASPEKGSNLSLQKDGEKAFEELYRTYWYKLYCIARKQTTSPHDAEELVQSLFEKIWKDRATISPNNWGPFLAISLRNLIIDFHRRQALQRKFLQNYQPSTPISAAEEELHKDQLQAIINNHLQELPQKTQHIFKLSRFEHKSVKEIAGSMQLTEKAVEYHITKSIKLLRHYLREHLSFFFQLF